MDSQKLPILFNVIAAFLGAAGQWAYKRGGLKISEVPWWMNGFLALGILLFCGVMVCFVIGYKMGGRISVVYPFYATTFLWGSLIGLFLEKEPFRWSLVAGTLCILIGLVVIAQGQRS
jgi:drug/metabolite transporter (DMT)-like permease